MRMRILICPICKSDKINLYLGGYAGMLYRCPSCGYIGPVTIEVDDSNVLKELEELTKGIGTLSVEEEHIDEREKVPKRKIRRGGIK